jgi:TAP-like protein
MYEPALRMRLLRALAALEDGDRSQLVRLVSVLGGASRSGFTYYATWCADDHLSPSGRTDDFDGLSAYLRSAGVSEDDLDLGLVLAPCLYWPYQPPAAGPPAEASTVPTLILTATADPITPPALAHAIAARHPEARLVETRGGSHGSIGAICADDRMRDFILDAKLPVGATSVCTGSVIAPYIPDAPQHVAGGLDAALGQYWELLAEPEVYLWDGTSPLDFGCGDAGWAHLDPTDADGHASLTLHGCSWSSNTPFDGFGWLVPGSRDASLQLTSRSTNTDLHLETDHQGVHVTGTWHGTTVDGRW